MGEYPGHLCPLCGKVLKIVDSTIVNINFLRVGVECENIECPFCKIYKIGVENIRKYGVSQS